MRRGRNSTRKDYTAEISSYKRICGVLEISPNEIVDVCIKRRICEVMDVPVCENLVVSINNTTLQEGAKFSEYWHLIRSKDDLFIKCDVTLQVKVSCSAGLTYRSYLQGSNRVLDVYRRTVEHEVEKNSFWMATIERGGENVVISRTETIIELMNDPNWTRSIHIRTKDPPKLTRERAPTITQFCVVLENGKRIKLEAQGRSGKISDVYSALSQGGRINPNHPIRLFNENGNVVPNKFMVRKSNVFRVVTDTARVYINVGYKGDDQRVLICKSDTVSKLKERYSFMTQTVLPERVLFNINPDDTDKTRLRLRHIQSFEQTVDAVLSRCGFFSVTIEEDTKPQSIAVLVSLETNNSVSENTIKAYYSENTTLERLSQDQISMGHQDITDYDVYIQIGKQRHIVKDRSMTLRMLKIDTKSEIVICQRKENIVLEFESIEVLDISKYTVGEVIGMGATGTVRKLINNKNPSNILAVKYVRIEKKQSIEREVKALMMVNHPCILDIRSIDTSVDGNLGIATTFMESTLANEIKNRRMTSTDKACYLMGIILGMEYLHKKRIVHRDLKPENVFVNPKTCEVRIGDFGLSKIIADGTSSVFSSGVGTILYEAPELLVNEPGNSKSDVFSFACVMYKVLTGDSLLDDNRGLYKYAEAIIDGVRPAVPDYIYDQPLGDLLKQCWHGNPHERPTFSEIRKVFENERYAIEEDVDWLRVQHTIDNWEYLAEQLEF